MALDHTRDFFFGLTPDPTDLAVTTPALFATRWITHVCAPGFLLLAGISARLLRDRTNRRNLFVFLILRGAMLIVLELTIITFAWIPDPGRLILLQVIWAIGWSMILLALLLWLPAAALGALAVAIMIVPLADLATLLGIPDWLVVLLFRGDQVLSIGGSNYIVSYAIVPWAAVMAFGYWVGGVVVTEGRLRVSACVGLGCALLAVFVVARTAGLGDPADWSGQDTAARTVMSFLNVEKYPPSPAYLALTLGLVFLLFAAFDTRAGHRPFAWLQALGRASLFFYVLHLYVLRSIGLAAAALVWGVDQLGPPPRPSAPEVAPGPRG